MTRRIPLLLAAFVAGCSGGGGSGGGGGFAPDVTAVSDVAGDSAHPSCDVIGFIAGCDEAGRPWAVLAFASPDEPPQAAHEYSWSIVMEDANGVELELLAERYQGVHATVAEIDGVETPMTIDAETSGATRHLLADEPGVIGCPVRARVLAVYLATSTRTAEVDVAPTSGFADVSMNEPADPTDAADRQAIDAELAGT